MLFWKDVGNGILLDRPLPFKLHQSYWPLPCFIPALQDIWSDPAKNSAVMTSTPRSASHYRGNAVIVTALDGIEPSLVRVQQRMREVNVETAQVKLVVLCMSSSSVRTLLWLSILWKLRRRGCAWDETEHEKWSIPGQYIFCEMWLLTQKKACNIYYVD